MLPFLLNIDKWLFYAINKGLSNPVFDSIMPFVTTNNHWLLVYIVLFVWLFWKGGKTGRICAVALVAGIVLTDQINSFFIKETFLRLRPCHALAEVRLLVPCGVGKSFFSSHATNTFVAAYILSYFYKQYKYILLSLAGLISFSRVYVGVHYPADIICGAAFGIFIGWIIVYIAKKIELKLKIS